VNATAKQPKNPSLVGFVFLVLTKRLIMTKTKVHMSSISKTFAADVYPTLGSKSACYDRGTFQLVLSTSDYAQ